MAIIALSVRERLYVIIALIAVKQLNTEFSTSFFVFKFNLKPKNVNSYCTYSVAAKKRRLYINIWIATIRTTRSTIKSNDQHKLLINHLSMHNTTHAQSILNGERIRNYSAFIALRGKLVAYIWIVLDPPPSPALLVASPHYILYSNPHLRLG